MSIKSAVKKIVLKFTPAPKPVLSPHAEQGLKSRPDWSKMWEECSIDSNRLGEVEKICNEIIKNKERYLAVERVTKVPWYLIAAIHYRESSLNFKACLHNGDPLPGPTKRVPIGRGPFPSWEVAAIDALVFDGLNRITFDGPISCLILAEKFNGVGYRKVGLDFSPYVWAGTSWSDETGKFTSDRKYDPDAIEKQLGVAAIVKFLLDSH